MGTHVIKSVPWGSLDQMECVPSTGIGYHSRGFRASQPWRAQGLLFEQGGGRGCGDIRTEQMILWDLSVEVVLHFWEVWRVGTWEEEERKLGI